MVLSWRRISVAVALSALAATSVEAFTPAVVAGVLPLRRHSAASRSGNALSPVMMAKGKGGGAAAKVQVLLKESVEGVGKANQVITVNTGYYNNFLRPKRLANIISDDEVVVKKANEADALEEIKQEAILMGTLIEGMGPVVLKRKTGKNNNIFGTITHKQIADVIKEKSGGKVTFNQKMKWTVPDVQGLGDFSCSVQLHPEVSQEVKVSVQAEK